jgi:glycosyltransferase 2 family protein
MRKPESPDPSALVDMPGFSAPASGSKRRVYAPVASFAKVVWPVALSIAVLAVIAAFTFNVSDFRETVQSLNPWFLTAAVGAVVLRVFLTSWRLHYVGKGALGRMAALRGQLAWEFFNNVTPPAIGGGPVAAVYVARDRQIPLGESTAILLFSMLLDQLLIALLIPALLFASTFMPVFPPALGPVGTGAVATVFVGMMIWVLLFGYAVLFRPEWLQKVVVGIAHIKWLRRYKARVAAEMEQLNASARVLRKQPPGFFVNGILLTAAAWGARFVLPLLIVWSVYPSVDKDLFLFRTVAISVGTTILPTPGGSGGVEGLYVLFLGPLMPETVVAPTLLVWRVLAYYLFLGVGVYLFMHHAQTTIQRKNDTAAAKLLSSGIDRDSEERGARADMP